MSPAINPESLNGDGRGSLHVDPVMASRFAKVSRLSALSVGGIGLVVLLGC